MYSSFGQPGVSGMPPGPGAGERQAYGMYGPGVGGGVAGPGVAMGQPAYGGAPGLGPVQTGWGAFSRQPGAGMASQVGALDLPPQGTMGLQMPPGGGGAYGPQPSVLGAAAVDPGALPIGSGARGGVFGGLGSMFRRPFGGSPRGDQAGSLGSYGGYGGYGDYPNQAAPSSAAPPLLSPRVRQQGGHQTSWLMDPPSSPKLASDSGLQGEDQSLMQDRKRTDIMREALRRRLLRRRRGQEGVLEDNEGIAGKAAAEPPAKAAPEPLRPVFRPLRARIDEERSQMLPLVLEIANGGLGRRIAHRLYSWVWRFVGLLGSPEAWLERMFQSQTDESEDAGTAFAPALQPYDDGLYRAPSNIHEAEPWNRERLHLQLGRFLPASAQRYRELPGSDREATIREAPPTIEEDAAEFEDFLAEEDHEILGCGLCAPRLLTESATSSRLAPRTRSHVKLKRRQLSATQLFELRVDVMRVTLQRVPHRDGGKTCDPFDTTEGRAAAEMQELYHRYRQEVEADLILQMDSRLDVLVDHGKALLQEFSLEDSAGQVASPSTSRESYRRHLEERSKLRLKRDEKEQQFENLCRNLYSKWRELRQIRVDQGFTSTPWKLRAYFEEHDTRTDSERQKRNIDAEVEERIGLFAANPEQARREAEDRWARDKRAPGDSSYRFEIFAGEEVTSTETLKERIRDQDLHTVRLGEELELRRRIARVRIYITCRVGDQVIGSSPVFRLHWGTWSTASHTALEAALPGPSTTAHALGPIHTFDLAVHFMPRSLSLTVYVAQSAGCGPCFTKWRPCSEVEVDIPSLEGRRVTHAAVLEQQLRFGPPVADVLDSPTGRLDLEDEEAPSGEVAVSVSWPGAGQYDNGFVVPPPRLPGNIGRRGDSVQNSYPGCFPCRSSTQAPRRQLKLPDERLFGLRYDPHDPENARMLMESPAPKALPGYDLYRLGSEHSRLTTPGSGPNGPGIASARRVRALLDRAIREDQEKLRITVPAFEKEVATRVEGYEKVVVDLLLDPTSPGVKPLQRRFKTNEQKEFLNKIRARVRKVELVKTHLSYASIVSEYAQEQEESDLFGQLANIAKSFNAAHQLRPDGGKRKILTSAHQVYVHVSLAKVYNAPIRCEDLQQSSARRLAVGGINAGTGGFGMAPPGAQSYPFSNAGQGAPYASEAALGGYGGVQTGYGGVGGLDAESGYGGLSSAAGSALVLFGAPAHGLPPGVQPEITIEMALQDLDGNLVRRRTTRVNPSTDPDINQILEIPLEAHTKEDLSQEIMDKYKGNLVLNIFDEVMITAEDRGSDIHMRRQRRHLGRFVLPWSTLYASKCSLRGHFRVEQPIVVFGYRNKLVRRRKEATKGAPEGGGFDPAAGMAAGSSPADDDIDPDPMYVRIDVTVDPALEQKERIQSPPARGKESTVLLKHVQKWTDSFRKKGNRKVEALGTDMDGQSRLLCRFVHPQRPPEHIDLENNPFAIEAAARYVSLIPYMRDDEMSPLVDLWCTDQEFLNIQCGDWEEHCILLCNYFNYIDRYRKAFVSGYGETDIQSYCVLCEIMPDGPACMVLRRDRKSGHCELWQAVTGECYFMPKRERPSRCCPQRRRSSAGDDGGELRATPLSPLQRVHTIFNAENVWANMQSSRLKAPELELDVGNEACWKPLFAGGYAELLRLCGEGGARRRRSKRPSTAAGGGTDNAAAASSAANVQTDYQIEPSLRLVYEPVDTQSAANLETTLERKLEEDIMEYRSMGESGGRQKTTTFNRVIAQMFGELLNDLERLCQCRRKHGNESIFPLRSHGRPPISFGTIDVKMQQIEREFQTVAGRGGYHSVYGIPFHMPYTDLTDIWEVLRDSRILELGDEKSEYALKVRVFPYQSRVVSVWVMVACSMTM